MHTHTRDLGNLASLAFSNLLRLSPLFSIKLSVWCNYPAAIPRIGLSFITQEAFRCGEGGEEKGVMWQLAGVSKTVCLSVSWAEFCYRLYLYLERQISLFRYIIYIYIYI